MASLRFITRQKRPVIVKGLDTINWSIQTRLLATSKRRMENDRQFVDGVQREEAVSEEAIRETEDALNDLVAAWGKDKLAPTETESSYYEPESPNAIPPKRQRKGGPSAVFHDQAMIEMPVSPPLVEKHVQVRLLNDGISSKTLEPITVPGNDAKPPKLAHGLKSVLRDSKVHWNIDPETNAHNFDPQLDNLPEIGDYDIDLSPGFVPSGKDKTLAAAARQEGRPFIGSTSSLTGILSSIYKVLSNWRQPNGDGFSEAFLGEDLQFSPGSQLPDELQIVYKHGVYSVNSVMDDEPHKNLLGTLGIMMETLLTTPADKFKNYLRSNPHPDQSFRRSLSQKSAYLYSKSRKFVMRSQLDCHDKRLPGSGVFDLKSRGTLAIRHDPFNHQKVSAYTIDKERGELQSFEREYFDLVRSAFLKYNFQVRIGNMAGIFVAYHNTKRIFGYQYIPRTEMDTRLFGGPAQGDLAFAKCVESLEHIISEIVECYPKQNIKVYYHAKRKSDALHIYFKPENGKGPLRELLVQAHNYIGEEATSNAFEFPADKPEDWQAILTMSRSRPDPELEESLERDLKKLKYSIDAFKFWLPEGVSPDLMARRWLALDYSGKSSLSITTVDDNKLDYHKKTRPRDMDVLRKLEQRFRGREKPSPLVARIRRLAAENLSAELGQQEASETPATVKSIKLERALELEARILERLKVDALETSQAALEEEAIEEGELSQQANEPAQKVEQESATGDEIDPFNNSKLTNAQVSS